MGGSFYGKFLENDKKKDLEEWLGYRGASSHIIYMKKI